MALKAKSKATLDTIINNPKKSSTEAYLDNHGTVSRPSASANVHKLLRKTEAQIYLKKHANRAKTRVVELVESTKPDIALRASVEILDRTYGKSVQRSVSENTNLNINVEASKELGAKFAEFMRSNTAS